jgi:hypothetical protein
MVGLLHEGASRALLSIMTNYLPISGKSSDPFTPSPVPPSLFNHHSDFSLESLNPFDTLTAMSTAEGPGPLEPLNDQ